MQPYSMASVPSIASDASYCCYYFFFYSYRHYYHYYHYHYHHILDTTHIRSSCTARAGWRAAVRRAKAPASISPWPRGALGAMEWYSVSVLSQRPPG